jgi:formate dehydrogenase maturation protein FdhE
VIKTGKRVRLEIDGAIYTSQKAPEPIDEWDGTCPACGSARYAELITIVQHGFITDDCLTLVHCSSCYETFHYYYTVEAECLDECRPLELKPPTGG